MALIVAGLGLVLVGIGMMLIAFTIADVKDELCRFKQDLLTVMQGGPKR